ncbi:MAG: T9SS type A sorting domain-containing protein [Bacteroidetes bacterium]|nr:T9SS type A sorting domain-containing protein [Bacteroidota bacterium]
MKFKFFFSLSTFFLSTFFLRAQSPGWTDQMGSHDGDKGNSIASDAFGNIYSAGIFYDTIDFDPGPGVYTVPFQYGGMYLQKLDANGNFLWVKVWQIYNVDEITLDANGNIYLTGGFQLTTDFDPGPGVYNMTCPGFINTFVMKLNPLGNFLWAKGIIGAQWNEAYSIAVDGSGNVFTTGFFNSTADFDPGSGTDNLTPAGSDIFVQKLDANGIFLWADQMGGSTGEQGQGIAVDANGYSYITGFFTSTPCDFDPGPSSTFTSSTANWTIFIEKLDPMGNFVWVRKVGNSSYNEGNSIVLDNAGHLYVTGYFYQSCDFDPNSGSYVLSSLGTSDIFILKLDTATNFIWAKREGGNLEDEGKNIITDATGNVYLTGFFKNNSDFDPGAGTFFLTSSGVEDIFVQVLDASGNLVWAKKAGGTAIDVGNSVTVDMNGVVTATGYFDSTADFDPGPGVHNLVSAGYEDIFITQMNLTTQVAPSSGENYFSVFPNPSSGEFKIETDPAFRPKEIRVTDVAGKLILEESVAGQTQFRIDKLPAGVYLLILTDEEDRTLCKKIISTD